MPITNPDWVPPIEMTFDVGRPIRSEQGLLLAGNPIAIAQGAPGAPKVQGVALDRVYLGHIFRRNTTDGIGFNDLDNCRGLFFSGVERAVGQQVRIRYSTDNGATFGSWQDVYSPGAGRSFFINMHVDLVTGDVFVFLMEREPSGNDINDLAIVISGSTVVPSGVNAFQIGVSLSSANVGFRMDVFAIGGKA